MSARRENKHNNAIPLDSDVETFVRTSKAASRKLAGDQPISVQQRRTVAEIVRENWSNGGPTMARSEDVLVGDNMLRIRIHVPDSSDEDCGLLIYLHGGGWVMFSIDTHDRLMREYAHRTGMIVVGLDYSLSPEHRYPQALDDVDTLYGWLEEERQRSGRFCGQCVIGGDSAGANLALCSTIRRRDRGLSLPEGLLLNYAAIDTTMRESHSRFDGETFMLGVDEMGDFWKAYLGRDDTEDPYARPLLANLAALPRVHLCIAECDILLDENIELRDRLIEAGCQVSSKVYKGATHSFLEAVRISALAQRAVQDAADWLTGQRPIE